jgi:hypothetical protein
MTIFRGENEGSEKVGVLWTWPISTELRRFSPSIRGYDILVRM